MPHSCNIQATVPFTGWCGGCGISLQFWVVSPISSGLFKELKVSEISLVSMNVLKNGPASHPRCPLPRTSADLEFFCVSLSIKAKTGQRKIYAHDKMKPPPWIATLSLGHAYRGRGHATTVAVVTEGTGNSKTEATLISDAKACESFIGQGKK